MRFGHGPAGPQLNAKAVSQTDRGAVMTQAEQNQIRELRSLLRSSEDPFWSSLRDLLRHRGVDPARAVLATRFPDDISFEFGIIVSPECSVFQFGFNYLDRSVADGVFTEWEDLSARSGSSPHCNAINEAAAY